MTDINNEQRQKIVAEIPELQKCFQCGTCVSSCPASVYGSSFSPREFILDCLRGMQDKVMGDNLWRCITCNSCNERCPQDVNPYEVIIKLKNIALREGLVGKERREELITSFNALIDTGLAYPVSELTSKRRTELGLKQIDDVDLNKVTKKR